MSETKHTPGPWAVGISADNGIMCVDAPEFGQMEICEVWGEEKDKTVTPMSTANARLIAAAPELLEALKALLKLHDDGDYDGPDPAELARAAIAKAEGVTHETP